MSSSKVLISGLKQHNEPLNVFTVVLFLEDPTKCPEGGDVIEDPQLCPNDEDSAILTFPDSTVARRIAERGSLTVCGRRLTVKLYSETQSTRPEVYTSYSEFTKTENSYSSDEYCSSDKPEYSNKTAETTSTSAPQTDNNSTAEEVASHPTLPVVTSIFQSSMDSDEDIPNPLNPESSSISNVKLTIGSELKKQEKENIEHDTEAKITNSENAAEGKTHKAKEDLSKIDSITPKSEDHKTIQLIHGSTMPKGEGSIMKFDNAEKFYLVSRIWSCSENKASLNSENSSLDFNTEKQEVVIYGNEQTMRLRLYEIIGDACTKSFSGCDKTTLRFLSTAKGIKLIDSLLNDKKIAGVAFVDSDSKGAVLAENQSELDKALKLAYEHITCQEIIVNKEFLAFLESTGYQDVVSGLLKDKAIVVELTENKDKLLVCGSKPEVEDTVKHLKDLLHENGTVTVEVGVASLELKLLSKYHKDEIQTTISKSCPDGNVTMAMDSSTTTISLSGMKKHVAVAEKILKEQFLVKVIKNTYDAVVPGVKIEQFYMSETDEAKMIAKLEGKTKSIIDPQEEKEEEVLNLRSGSHGEENDEQESGGKQKASASSKYISAIKDNLTKFENADVLVCPLATKATSLENCGAVAKSFYDAGGPQLQEELEKVGLPSKFGTGVFVTPATGNLKAKKIFHIAIRSYRNDKSNKLLKASIVSCLNQAVQEGLSSIAFPTLGCGGLKYDAGFVARAFKEAVEEVNSGIKVYIICFPKNGPYEIFNEIINASCSSSLDQESAHSRTARMTEEFNAPLPDNSDISADYTSRFIQKAVKIKRRRICFYIYSLNEGAFANVKEKLDKYFKKATLMKTVEAPNWNFMSSKYQEKIIALGNRDVEVKFDEKTGLITIRGAMEENLKTTKKKICEILEIEDKTSGLERIKRTQGVKTYLEKLSYLEDIPYPNYWEHFKNPGEVFQEFKIVNLDKKSTIYETISKLISSTWDSTKAGGAGKDAQGLSHRNIKIKNISVVENPMLFREYFAAKKILCGKASFSPFPSINGLNGESELLTATDNQTKKLMKTNMMTEEINEYYLLHGTPRYNEIANTGPDFRYAGRCMFGKGAYFAESSTKVDQYADDRKDRSAAGTSLYMFVLRVALGTPHICKEPYQFRKPPCNDPNCRLLDNCSDPSHGECHSVVGTVRWTNPNQTDPGSPTSRLLFREFIIYDVKRAYPDFLVEYVRE